MERQTPTGDRGKVREYAIRPLGLIVGVSWRGLHVRRWRSEWRVPQQTASDWARYCVEVRRR
ncbi:MAG: hypothetical protein U0794_22110 [Isosphaeraceae bacterium]